MQFNHNHCQSGYCQGLFFIFFFKKKKNWSFLAFQQLKFLISNNRSLGILKIIPKERIICISRELKIIFSKKHLLFYWFYFVKTDMVQRKLATTLPLFRWPESCQHWPLWVDWRPDEARELGQRCQQWKLAIGQEQKEHQLQVHAITKIFIWFLFLD